MSLDSENQAATSKLPFKLRFKEASTAAAVNIEDQNRQFEEDFKPINSSVEQDANQQDPKPVLKASKIAGIAPKKVPRVGSQYQADIPDLRN